MSEKQCWNCKKSLPLTSFYNRKDAVDGKGSHCRQCHSQYIMARWIAMKERAIAHMGGKCADCNRSYPRSVYDFHHLDPTKKDMQWNQLRKRSWNCVLKELAKCVMLCSNCHRIRHINED